MEINGMAQRTIHMLFATLLADKIDIFDKNRFLIGSILPDAYINPTNYHMQGTEYRLTSKNSILVGLIKGTYPTQKRKYGNSRVK